ncbi:hypothetical protein Hdeb2414_s0056g00757081 [Helianthus debilis subsp. tardiflorus]
MAAFHRSISSNSFTNGLWVAGEFGGSKPYMAFTTCLRNTTSPNTITNPESSKTFARSNPRSLFAHPSTQISTNSSYET